MISAMQFILFEKFFELKAQVFMKIVTNIRIEKGENLFGCCKLISNLK